MGNACIFNKILLWVLYLSYAVDLSNCGFQLKTTDYLTEWHNLITRYRRQAECDFRCDSGECISGDALCDGKTDCQDGSDETTLQCQSLRCPSFLFQCKYGACIQKNQVCDGTKHCADNSDEETPNCSPPKVTGGCANFEYRCDDGTCIDNLNTCDGKRDCPDGSDETEEACTGLVCQTYLFRCAYGACVANSAKCNGVRECADGSDEVGCGTTTTEPVTPPVTPTVPVTQPSSGCILPPHVPHGKFKLVSGSVYQENTVVSLSTGIHLTCDPGYNYSSSQVFFCLNNNWIPDIPQTGCTRTCPPLKYSDTYTAVCKYLGSVVSCDTPLEGTTAEIKCNAFFTYGVRPIPSCQDGTWDPYPAPCDAECGQKIVNAQTLIVGGSDALPGEYPWIVAVYNNQSNHICGGTIISRFFIISAAHCFTDSQGTVYNENLYTVAVGKYYRELSKPENGTQIRKIKRLRIHEDYRGRLTKYRDDIALLEVDKLDLTNEVQPVCLDWENRFEHQDFVENNKAVVAGWGKILEGSTPAEVLKKLIVPYRSTDTCQQFMDPEFFKQYYSSDKICAGYKDEGSSVCSGDSGGGLYFKSELTTFYVRAVVSLAPRSETGCDSNHYALYTKVSRYLDWISSITRKRI